MRFGLLLGVVCAIVLHGGFILFGGLICPSLRREAHATTQQVELLSENDADEKSKPRVEPPPEKKEEKKEEIETQEEKPPDAAEIIRSIELSATNQAPALEAASLSAIESALSGQGGGGDFGEALSFASGGRIGGTGKAGVLEETMEKAFSLDEIDQKPRVIFQAAPIYPSEMRGKKVEGVVTVIFLVDANGKVTSPKVEKSSASAFDRPALDAIKRWKFQAAVKGGRSVSCRMRETIRFQAN